MVFPFIGIIPRSIVPPRFPHVVANGKVLFLFFFTIKLYSIIWTLRFFMYSSVNRHLGYFHTLAIINNALINTEVHASFQIGVYLSLRKYPVVELLDDIVFLS